MTSQRESGFRFPPRERITRWDEPITILAVLMFFTVTTIAIVAGGL